jgi:hypothetical protein
MTVQTQAAPRGRQPRAVRLALRSCAALLVAAAGACSNQSGWSVEQKTDAMSDASLASATATFAGEDFDVEAEVTCNQAGFLDYKLVTFDKSGEPAPFRPGTRTGAYFVQFRPDKAKAETAYQTVHRFNNQILIRGFQALRAARATQLSVKFPLLNGEETLTIDQSDPKFRAAMQTCLD